MENQNMGAAPERSVGAGAETEARDRFRGAETGARDRFRGG